MRQSLNENPVVQMAVIGVIALIGVFMLFTTVLKKDEAPVTDPAAATADPAVGAAPVTPSTDPSATAPVPTAAVAPGAGAVEAPPPAGLEASKGLPMDVIKAFADNQTIALLVIDPKGISDREVETYTKLASRGDNEIFIVDVKDIAEYSRITSGVAVSQAPALVVIRPRKLTDNVPIASVSYGFRGPRSVEQALDDALYSAGPVPSYP